MLNEKNVKYEPGHHHDYIMHAAYLFNRFGVPQDDLIKFADIEWRDHPKEERDRAIRHRYNLEKKENERQHVGHVAPAGDNGDSVF